MSIQLRNLRLLIQHFMILKLRHATFNTQSLKGIQSGRETGLIDTGPLMLKYSLLILFCETDADFHQIATFIL